MILSKTEPITPVRTEHIITIVNVGSEEDQDEEDGKSGDKGDKNRVKAADNPTRKDPSMPAAVPRRVTPPLVPAGTCLHGIVMRIGVDLLITPISEPSVSEEPKERDPR